MNLQVGLTFNAKSDHALNPDGPADANAEFDSEETLVDIQQALERTGCEVERLGSPVDLMQRLPGIDVDIVFNIAEGKAGRNRESQVPVMLEMCGIPYVGSDGLTMALTLDKFMAKQVFLASGIPTPRAVRLDEGVDPVARGLSYPLIVKLRQEGSSKGITADSVVRDESQLWRQVDRLRNLYSGAPIIAEEFITGRECTVFVVGNESPRVLPVAQVCIDNHPQPDDRFFTYEDLHNPAVSYQAPADLDEDLTKRLQRLALAVYQSVECKDMGRVDFRIDRQGRPFVLEINPLPSLARNDSIADIVAAANWTYEQLIREIFEAALKRYGLMPAADRI